jgi:hypothetical protein
MRGKSLLTTDRTPIPAVVRGSVVGRFRLISTVRAQGSDCRQGPRRTSTVADTKHPCGAFAARLTPKSKAVCLRVGRNLAAPRISTLPRLGEPRLRRSLATRNHSRRRPPRFACRRAWQSAPTARQSAPDVEDVAGVSDHPRYQLAIGQLDPLPHVILVLVTGVCRLKACEQAITFNKWPTTSASDASWICGPALIPRLV